MIPNEIEYYKQSNFSLIPVKFRDKPPSGKLISRVTGSRTWKTFTSRIPTDQELTHWFDNNPCNVGVVTGWNDLAVLDFDDMSQYSEWADWIQTNKPEALARILDQSLIVATSRGIHIYIYLEDCKPRKFNKLDLKGKWGYVLAPPSVHPSGKLYRFLYKPSSLDLPKFGSIEELLPYEWIEQEFEQKEILPRTELSLWDQANVVYKPIGEIDYEWLRDNARIENYMPTGGELKRSGKYLLCLCPFHPDHNPSFWIDTELNICGCYAGCFQNHQTIFGFYARLKSITINEAIIEINQIERSSR